MKKLLQLALVCAMALGAMSITSCSKSEDSKIAYTFGTDVVKNAWTGYSHVTGDFYGETANFYFFGISGTVKSMDCFMFESDDPFTLVPNAIMLMIPASKLGQQLDMNLNHDVANEGHFRGTIISNRLPVMIDPIGWIKVTKNSENNFTIECDMTFGSNKLLKANYTGTFTKYDDFADAFLCGL